MSKRRYKVMPTQARLRELFDYCDGVLYHKVNKGTNGAYRCIGEKAGFRTNTGHMALSIDDKKYLVHRAVWAWHYGTTPAGMEVNHINSDRTDNRIENLRLASRMETAQHAGMRKDNVSGFKGVSFCKDRRKWVAQITINRRQTPLGRFDTKEEAHAAYCAAAERYFGEFANFGTSRQYVQPPRKDAPPSLGQMTGVAGARGRDSQETSLDETNRTVALTDNAPATQALERVAKRQTRTAEGVTGARFCKRCAGHRKSSGGLFLTDAINRRYWVCQPCCEKFQTKRPADSARANAGRAQA